MRTDENSFEKFQRLLRTPEGKKKEITACLLPLKQQSEIALKNIEEYESKEKMFDDEKKRIEDKPKFTGISDRELYLKNKKIIEEKAKGLHKHERQPKLVSSKIVNILSAQYGLTDIKTIDVTDKIILGEKFTNELAGEDPAPKRKKNIFIKAMVDGKETEATFIEGKRIIF